MTYVLEKGFRESETQQFRRAHRGRGPKFGVLVDTAAVPYSPFVSTRPPGNERGQLQGPSVVRRRRVHGHGQNETRREACQGAGRRSRVGRFHPSECILRVFNGNLTRSKLVGSGWKGFGASVEGSGFAGSPCPQSANSG